MKPITNIEQFKEWLEKEIEAWETHYDNTSADDTNKLSIIHGRLQELLRIKNLL